MSIIHNMGSNVYRPENNCKNVDWEAVYED